MISNAALEENPVEAFLVTTEDWCVRTRDLCVSVFVCECVCVCACACVCLCFCV